MPNNNPAGTNSPVAFDQFTRTVPYGEKKVQGDLQRTVPLAGQQETGPILGAADAAKRAATKPTAPSQPAPSQAKSNGPQAAPQPPPEPAGPPAPTELWQQLAQVPGASPLVLEYAQRAMQMEAPTA